MNLSNNTPGEIMINRNSLLYINEVNNWVKLLNRTFKYNKIIHWSPFIENINGLYINSLNKITIETNGEINNEHYSETGQRELANIFFEKINIIINEELFNKYIHPKNKNNIKLKNTLI
jgi:hypothetical protein